MDLLCLNSGRIQCLLLTWNCTLWQEVWNESSRMRQGSQGKESTAWNWALPSWYVNSRHTAEWETNENQGLPQILVHRSWDSLQFPKVRSEKLQLYWEVPAWGKAYVIYCHSSLKYCFHLVVWDVIYCFIYLINNLFVKATDDYNYTADWYTY